MKIPVLDTIMFSEPSIWVTATTASTMISTLYLCFGEIFGNHLRYSKFTNSSYSNNKPSSKQPIKLSSKIGMLILYTPAFLAGALSFVVFPSGDLRLLLLKFAVTFHFFKRDLEVVFVHKYSGDMTLGSTIFITISYFSAAASLIFVQYLSLGLSDPSIDTKFIGLIFYILGISGNFYHHILLSKLRNNDKEYKIPKGGLFDLIICPHYLFEFLMFVGISLISQTSLAFACTFGVSMYLGVRSYATRRWYVDKFEDFPKDVKYLIPYIF